MSKLKVPVNVCGTVVKGFGRGSKDLGIPTANFPEEVVEAHSDVLDTGVYYGWARVDDGPIHKMVMSVGWNPFYNNEKKSMETHIMQKYNADFYGSTLRVSILGYIRPEMNFPNLDELIARINADIDEAHVQLDKLGSSNDEFLMNSLTSQ